jgi:hypothetical protein
MLDMGFEPEVRAILSQTSSGLYPILSLPLDYAHASFGLLLYCSFGCCVCTIALSCTASFLVLLLLYVK